MASASIVDKIKLNLLNVVILILAVIIAFKVYKNKESGIFVLKEQMETEGKKNNVLIEISALEQKLAYLNKNVNIKTPNSLLDKIGDLAKTSGVKISRIIPQKEIAMGVYTKYPFELTLSVGSYHAVAKFISLLENSLDIFMIENLVISNRVGEEDNSIAVKLTVYTILINK